MKGKDMDPIRLAIIEMLGLQEDAADDVILNTLNDVLTQQDADALATRTAAADETASILADRVVELEETLVNRDLADHAGVITDDTREFWTRQLMSNRDAALKALAQARPAVKAPLHNRLAARPPAPPADLQDRAIAPGIAAQIRNRAHEIQKSEKIPFTTAWQKAQAEFKKES